MREAKIDRSAITHNVETLRKAVGTPHFMAVVKANGYGHGAVPAARAALDGGADWLGVVDFREAVELRSVGITAPVLTWLHDPDADFSLAVEHDLDVGVNSLAQLERAAAAGVTAVQVKVDTGLGRNGVARSEWPSVFARAGQLEREGRLRVRGLFSHLANAGAAEDGAQVSAFSEARALALAAGLDPELWHLAATAGALRVPAARFNLVRVGIGCYGLSPFDGEAAGVPLRPALELSAAIVAVKRVPAGSGISYGFTYRTESETTLALVPLGYADGVPRHASNRGPVSINGQTFRVSGTIAMDQFVVDVGDAAVAVGDRAILFGDPGTGVPSASEWAAAAGTINYELVARLGGRIQRTYPDAP